MALVSVTPTSGADGDNIDGTNTPGTDLLVRSGANSGVGTIQVETSNVTTAGTTRATRYAKTTTSGANYGRYDDTANDKWAVRLRGVYFNALPASAQALFLRLVTGADATAFTLTLQTNGKFTALDAAGSTIWNPTGMTGLSATVKYLIELWVDNDDTAGQLKVRCYRESDLVSMADSTLLTGLNMAAADLARLRVGASIATGSGSFDFQVDYVDTDAGATDYIPSPVTVTPSSLALTITTFAPTVTTTDHQTVTPSTAALSITTFAPTVTATANVSVTVPTATLTITTFAPTVTVTDHVTVTPSTAALTITTFAPTVTVTGHVVVTPPTAGLTLTTFEPTVAVTDHQTVTPPPATLTLTMFEPTVVLPTTVTPPTVALTLTTFAPTVTAVADVVVTPSPASLAITLFAPTVIVSITPARDITVTATIGPRRSAATLSQREHAGTIPTTRRHGGSL